ncbi:hypothetical protein [Gilvimarinus algae]|uniref:Uncharacterized protein n=1 Tax=Gilvimarinus algae TaxID=3058037 RepID=A0ABT8TD86_9GAMM|nr:hypothetical protein [Gilvimarinus sp. SDUM040014]MDO3381993.1 hypothetical protein [Gilvimarinus sp. SDUM040014]
MMIALLESLLTTAACTYTLLCDISPWLGQSAKIALSANWLMLAFAGYLFTLQ